MIRNVYVIRQRRLEALRAGPGQGGPDMLSSLRNNHMTILHSSLHKYIPGGGVRQGSRGTYLLSQLAEFHTFSR